jgi:hypothetical protein
MTRPTFYQTDDSGYYVGPVLGFLDPEEEDRWMPPFGAYADAPPLFGEHEIPQRVGDMWTIVPYYFGFIYWTAERTKHEISERGIAPPDGYLTSDPGPSAAEIAEKTRLELIAQAQDLLQKSDITVLRCFESGVPVPAAWRTWRASLRSVAASGSGVIEAAPAFPSGT